MSEPTLFDMPLARTTDPATSHRAAAQPFRRDSQRHKLLAAYGRVRDIGLIDDEAGTIAGIATGYWKRCSDLRNAGLIQPDGDKVRQGRSGADQQVCKITEDGWAMLLAVEAQ